MSSHVVNICSRKAHRPASNPRRLKAESRQFFIDLQLSRIYAYIRQPRSQSISCIDQILDTSTLSFASMRCNHHAEQISEFGSASHVGNISAAEILAPTLPTHGGNSSSLRGLGDHKTNKSNRNFTVTGGISVSCLDRAKDCKFWVYKTYGEKSFESITDSQLKHPP